MRKRGGRGLSSLLTSVVLTLVMIGVVLAGFQLSGARSIEDAVSIVKRKSLEYSECIPAGECGISTLIDDAKSVFNKESSGSKNSSEDNNDRSQIDSSTDVNNNIETGDNSEGETNNPNQSDNGSSTVVNQISQEEEGYRGPNSGEPHVNELGLTNKQSALNLLDNLSIVEDEFDKKKDIGYSMKEWKHWIGYNDRPCWNTRSEMLHRDAVSGTIKYIDKKKQPTENHEEACAIGVAVEDKKGEIEISTKKAGEWIDPYSGKKITDSKAIDIDHIIPLSSAARHGGQEWTSERKQEFANDPDNLLATSIKESRTKGEKSPGEYMPPNKSYHCQYAKTYTALSHKYDLTITESDHEVLSEAIKACKH